MTTYLVSCEATLPDLLGGVELVLNTYGEFAQLTKTLWAVITEKDIKILRDELKLLLESQGSEARVIIVKSGRLAAWSRSICPNKWLLDNL